MATYPVRVQNIVDALINTTSTASQQLRLGRALAHNEGLLDDFDAATNIQKTEMFVKASRRLYLRILREFEGDVEALTARQNKETQIIQDFMEVP